jgi:hypothetical protein
MKSDVRLVSTRGRHRVPGLRMSCDSEEIPAATPADSQWIMLAHYVGTAYDEDDTESTPEAVAIDIAASAALTLSPDRLCVIIKTDTPHAAAWFTIPRDHIEVVGGHNVGIFRKRPAYVDVSFPLGALSFISVNKLTPSRRRMQGNQEAAFLEALTSTVATR